MAEWIRIIQDRKWVMAFLSFFLMNSLLFLSAPQVEKRSKVVQEEYIQQYKSYLDEIQNQSEVLLGVSIFQQKDSFSNRNIQKTNQDFLDCTKLVLESGEEKAIVGFMDNSITDWFLFLLAGITCMYFIQEWGNGMRNLVRISKGGRGKLYIERTMFGLLFSVVSVLLFYGTTLFIGAFKYGGMGNLQRMLQSMPLFRGWSVPMEVGTFLGMFLLVKILVLFCCFQMIWFLFTIVQGKKGRILVFSGFVLIEALAWIFLSEQSRLAVLKYCNLFAYFEPEFFFGTYRNLNIFGNPVAFQGFFLGMVCVIGFGSWILNGICACKWRREKQGKTWRMGERVFARWGLLQFEWYKVNILQNGWAVVALVWIVCFRLDYTVPYIPQPLQDEITYYTHQLEGEITEKTWFYWEELWSQVEENRSALDKENTENKKTIREMENLYDTKQEALLRIEERMKRQEAMGKETSGKGAYLVCQEPFVNLYSFAQDSTLEEETNSNKVMQNQRMVLIVGCMAILFLFMSSFQREQNMKPLIYGTVRGRKGFVLAKWGVLVLQTGLISGIMALVKFGRLLVKEEFQFNTLMAPLHSLEISRQFSTTIGGAILMQWLGAWILFCLVGSLVLVVGYSRSKYKKN